MNVMQKQLLEFHRTMGSVVGCSPGLRDVQLRAQLILSEACETVTAMLGLPKEFELDVMAHLEQTIEESELPDPAPGAVDVEALAETIDGLCDLLYVTYGSGVAFGVDLEPYFNEVHRTNMLKAGGGRDDNGKVLKPKGWQPPRIKEMLQTQLACDIDPCPHIMYVPQSVTEVDPFDPLVIEAIEQAGEELKQDIIG